MKRDRRKKTRKKKKVKAKRPKVKKRNRKKKTAKNPGEEAEEEGGEVLRKKSRERANSVKPLKPRRKMSPQGKALKKRNRPRPMLLKRNLLRGRRRRGGCGLSKASEDIAHSPCLIVYRVSLLFLAAERLVAHSEADREFCKERHYPPIQKPRSQ